LRDPDKQALRTQLILTRARLSMASRHDRSERAVRHLLESGLLEGVQVLALYAARPEEADPYSFEAHAPQSAYPRVRGADLEFGLARRGALQPAPPWGILEPMEAVPSLALSNIDLFVVPGVGFGRDGERIGYGRGYYDRTLEKARQVRPEVKAIGFGFACQVSDGIPMRPGDQRLDGLVTEEGPAPLRSKVTSAPALGIKAEDMNIRIPPADEQLAILERGTVDLHPKEELKKRLAESHEHQKPLRIKTGFDPTAPDLHLGHTVLIEKMAQFQRLGHEVTFLIGDYTALIGDPTGRNAMRPPLSEEQIQVNAKTYTDQVFKILDRDRTIIEWNSKWLGKLSFQEVIKLAARYNVARMLERRDFKDRFESNTQIAIHELLYPLMQAYDSVALVPDVELGGHDQIFNLNAGRHIMEQYGQRPQCVLTVGLLVGAGRPGQDVQVQGQSRRHHRTRRGDVREDPQPPGRDHVDLVPVVDRSEPRPGQHPSLGGQKGPRPNPGRAFPRRSCGGRGPSLVRGRSPRQKR
jgi:5,10-methenyltetrahydrofolate synthetase